MQQLIATILLLLAPGNPSGEEGKRPSIEELIRLAKEKSDKSRAEIETRVKDLVAQLELPYEKNSIFINDRIEDICKMGPQVVPLLVPYLNNNGNDDRAVQKGRNCARAILKFDVKDSATEFMALLQNGTKEGKLNAIFILGLRKVIEAEKLIQGFLSSEVEPDLRITAIQALGRMKSENSIEALTTLLKSADTQTASAILDSLDSIHSPKAVPAVAALLLDNYFRSLMPRILNFLNSMGNKETLPYLLRTLSLPDLSSSQTIQLLQSIGKLGSPSFPQGVQAIKPLLGHADKDVRDEAAYALNELGDESGVKNLLTPYDDYVKDYRSDPRAYETRGKVLLRLHRYKEALKDFKEGVHVAKKDAPVSDLYILQARCHAAMNQLKDAYNALKATDLDSALLAKYKDLPEFKALRDHDKYGQIFGK